MLNKDIANTALNGISKAISLAREANTESLIEYTKGTRVEPIVLLDNSLRGQSYITDVLHSLNSIFAGYYLQAVAISTNVGSIEVLRLLDKLNTTRDPLIGVGLESYHIGLGEETVVSTEARKDYRPRRGEVDTSQQTKLYDDNNLSVGKMVQVNIEENGHKISIPINIRLMVKSIAPNGIPALLAVANKDTSAKARYHQWKAGELRFINDIILCQDIIDNEKELAKADKDGILSGLKERRSKNRIAGALTMNPSVNNASGIMVLNKTTAERVERELGGKLKKNRIREKLFENTLCMLMAVVDTEWDQVVIYHRGIAEPTHLSIREVKNASKGGGPDISQILAAYRLGDAPSF